jgi:phage tail-like protein
MPTRRDFDHIGSHRFTVEIDHVVQGRFQAVSAFGAEADVVEFQDGDDLILRKRPGRIRYDDVVLTRGHILADELWDWWKAVQEGAVERKSMSIILHDSVGQEIRRWNLFECWPRRWQMGPLDGEASECLVEQIVIVTEKLELG